MILLHLPPVLRSLHEATGVGIWLSCFVLAYLALLASRVETKAPATIEEEIPRGGALVDAVEPLAPKPAVPTMAVIVARGADV